MTPSVISEGSAFCRAGRSGVYVESGGDLQATCCRFDHNGHYGVQTQPKGRVLLEDCSFNGNRRGEMSGTGVQSRAGIGSGPNERTALSS